MEKPSDLPGPGHYPPLPSEEDDTVRSQSTSSTKFRYLTNGVYVRKNRTKAEKRQLKRWQADKERRMALQAPKAPKSQETEQFQELVQTWKEAQDAAASQSRAVYTA